MRGHVYAKDPNVSLKALDQTWKLDGAYAPGKIDFFAQMASTSQLLAEIQEIEKRKLPEPKEDLIDLDDDSGI